MIAIETKQLQKSFGSVLVVKGIDLVIEKGEIFGFLGRNGAGKSTFINMLTGIINPSAGTYSILGVQGPNNQIKKKLGVLPDYSSFYDSLTAMAHLKYLAAVSGTPVDSQRCLEVLQLVGIEGSAHKKVGKFSFGMKKKLGIAQAIIHDPEIIILDEPTSGLDAESVIDIQHLILKLQQNGKTIFMTSHNLPEVEKICTKIAIMKEGKIVKYGTMDELRSFYQAAIHVKFKHSPIQESSQMKNFLESIGTNLEFAPPYTSIIVESEKKIASILRAFHECKVDVYRVEVDEPTLEDIFLDE